MAEATNTRASLGDSPAVMARRHLVKRSNWCPKPEIDFDPICDPLNPKEIGAKEIYNAHIVLKSKKYRMTPLVRSKYCVQFGMELNYKVESLNKVGCFHERGAMYALSKITDDQKELGVYTASNGNWGLALAYQGQCFNIPVTVVFPVSAMLEIVDKCLEYNAKVVIQGKDINEAKKSAFSLMAENGGGTYINGYDHPHVIAACGSIGIEILQQQPNTDVIIVPVGGGGLIAGIAVAVKQIKPNVLIYGVESSKNCSFFKAMENDRPYQTHIEESIAHSLGVPTAGYNAYHTARSYIDKMMLVDDDWTCQAILHLYEEEKMIVQGAGAISLGALMAKPTVLPELRDKTVVCIISGGNMDIFTLPRALERAMAIEGRIIQLIVKMNTEDTKLWVKVSKIIGNVGCNILNCRTEKTWILENDLENQYLTIVCETRDLAHACTLRRVMRRFFPDIVEFIEEPFEHSKSCPCYPKKIQMNLML